MHSALPPEAAPRIARGVAAALLILAAFLALAAFAFPPSPRLLPWLSAGAALTVAGAATLAAAQRRSPGASAPTTAFIGS